MYSRRIRKLTEAQRDYLRNVPILVYHKIRPQKELGVTTVHPQLFTRHVQWLQDNGFQTVTLQQIMDTPIEMLPPKPVVISFDDGFSEVESIVAPILKTRGFVGVVFVISGFVGKANAWDVNLGGMRAEHLSASQLNNLSRWGWEIGSHTITHRALPYLNSKSLWQELADSRVALENLVNTPVTTIAYPFGLVNRRVVQVAQRAGYTIGLAATHASNRQKNALILSRIPIFPWDSVSRLKRKIFFQHAFQDQLVTTLVRFPAIFSPIYQVLFRPFLWKSHF